MVTMCDGDVGKMQEYISSACTVERGDGTGDVMTVTGVRESWG